MVWSCVCQGVRVPAGSLFHEEIFALFDLGVRGIPKILIHFLWVSPKNFWKTWGFCLGKKKVLPPQRTGGGRVKREAPRLELLSGGGKTFAALGKIPTFFQKFWAKQLMNFSNFDGTHNVKVKKCELVIVKGV